MLCGRALIFQQGWRLGLGRDAWGGFSGLFAAMSDAGSKVSKRLSGSSGHHPLRSAVGFWPFGEDERRRGSVFANGIALSRVVG